jgi:nicotinamidase-related amidase
VKTALLLVDIQKEYFPGGAMPLDGPVEAAVQAKKLLAHFRYNHLPAIFTMVQQPALGDTDIHSLDGEGGHECR